MEDRFRHQSFSNEEFEKNQAAPSNESVPSRSNKIKRLRVLRRNLAAFGVVVLIVGLVAAVAVAQTNFDLRQFAWGGVSFNSGALNGRQMSLEKVAQLQKGQSESAALFTQLTQTYFNADVANIDNPEFQIKGVVFKQYDQALNQTIVYARLENMPLLEAVPAMWLEQGIGQYLPAGVGEIVLENDVPVGYFMTTIEGTAFDYNTLNFSYDISVSQNAPSSVFMSVEFDEPQEQT